VPALLHPYGIIKHWGVCCFYKYFVPNGTVPEGQDFVEHFLVPDGTVPEGQGFVDHYLVHDGTVIEGQDFADHY
jgi:hypothetical protein